MNKNQIIIAVLALSLLGNRSIVACENNLTSLLDIESLTERLFYAVESCDFKGTSDALDRGANVNLKRDGRTPLHIAASMGHERIGHKKIGHKKIVELLIKKGALVNAIETPDSNFVGGATPLRKAVDADNEEMVRLLIAQGADVNLPDNLAHSPLDTVASSGNLNIAEMLLGRGAKVDGNSDRTPLCQAVSRGQLDMAKLLLERGANPFMLQGEVEVDNITKPALRVLVINAIRIIIERLLQATSDPTKLQDPKKTLPELPAEIILKILDEAYPLDKK